MNDNIQVIDQEDQTIRFDNKEYEKELYQKRQEELKDREKLIQILEEKLLNGSLSIDPDHDIKIISQDKNIYIIQENSQGQQNEQYFNNEIDCPQQQEIISHNLQVQQNKRKRKISKKIETKENPNNILYDSDEQFNNEDERYENDEYGDEQDEDFEDDYPNEFLNQNNGRKGIASSSGYDHSSPSPKQNMDLFQRFDEIAEKREEEQKKRDDPNRDFVINESLNFLEGLKFYNPQLDQNKVIIIIILNIIRNLKRQTQIQTKLNKILQYKWLQNHHKTRKSIGLFMIELIYLFEIKPQNGKILQNNVEFIKLKEFSFQCLAVYIILNNKFIQMYPFAVLSYKHYKPKLNKKKIHKSIHNSTMSSSSDDSSSLESSIESSKHDIEPEVDSSILSSKSDGSKDDRQNLSQSQSSSSKSSQSDSETISESSTEDFLKRFKIKEHFNFPPLYLDDSKIGQGKHMHVVSLPSYKMSMLPFVNPQRKKEEMNRVFQKEHPKISKNISLSKIRRIKQDMISIFLQQEIPYIEIYTVSHAWVLFEKLIYKGMVKKHNRRIVSAICLLIAFKCTEVYGGFKNNQKKFKRFNDDLLKLMKVQPRQQLAYYEIKVLARLNFHTLAPLRAIMPHMQSIMYVLDTNILDYLGEEAYNAYIEWNRLQRKNNMRKNKGRRRGKSSNRNQQHHHKNNQAQNNQDDNNLQFNSQQNMLIQSQQLPFLSATAISLV